MDLSPRTTEDASHVNIQLTTFRRLVPVADFLAT